MPARPRRVVLPNEEWRGLGRRRRREVARCARHGRAHHDPYVAAVARAWATACAAPVPARRWSAQRAAGMLGWLGLSAVFTALFGDAGTAFLVPGGSEWRERRLARRILAATSSTR